MTKMFLVFSPNGVNFEPHKKFYEPGKEFLAEESSAKGYEGSICVVKDDNQEVSGPAPVISKPGKPVILTAKEAEGK